MLGVNNADSGTFGADGIISPEKKTCYIFITCEVHGLHLWTWCCGLFGASLLTGALQDQDCIAAEDRCRSRTARTDAEAEFSTNEKEGYLITESDALEDCNVNVTYRTQNLQKNLKVQMTRWTTPYGTC